MELRTLTPDDAPALQRVMSEAFGGGRRPTEPQTPPAEDEPRSPVLGIFDGSRLVAAATIHDLPVAWGETDAPMGGIAGVACVADQRGRGHVARLLAQSLQQMYEAGQYLSGLYPFSYAFYRRHGWEWVGEKRITTVPTAEIKAYPEGQHLRCYDGPEAREIVESVYTAFAHRHRGMTTRTGIPPHFWKAALDHGDNRTTYVHVYHDPGTGQAEGYLTFRYPKDGDTGHVGDFFTNTPAAYRGLLSVLHYYGTQLRKVQYSAPVNDPLPLYVMHHDVDVRLRPLFMGRIVDVSAALAALRPATDITGAVILQVADSSCVWNTGTFEITVENGSVTVAPSQQTPGVVLDIQTLTQAYWGQPSQEQLRAADRLTVADEAQYSLLARLLPPAVCYLQDFF